MSCEACKPIVDGDTWRTEMEAEHSAQSVVALSRVMDSCSLTIYPAPYKAHNFWSTPINFCPYCGEDLQPKYRQSPKVVKESESNE